MQVAVIGCGYSGLSAIRRCIEYNVKCIAFELSSEVGGLWVYTDETGNDEYGIPIQTSLYCNVRANSPRPVLEIPDFKFRPEEDTDFPYHTEVRRYLNEFAQHFNLFPCIKFRHYVTRVSREKEKWKILVKDLKANKSETYYFDAVMIGNGHTTKPHIPNTVGSKRFEGLMLHSHDYRHSAIFENKNVLIVGRGRSAVDLAYESSKVAKKTFVSQRSSGRQLVLPIFIHKPPICEIKEYEVSFTDASVESVDVIVFCTGYEYHFPFMDNSCGITVEQDGHVIQPLYKHFINVHYPTMCFLGLFERTVKTFLCDLQVQAFLKVIKNEIKLPTKTEMFEWLRNEEERKKSLNIPSNQYYDLLKEQREYFKDIAEFANLANVPPVLLEMFRFNCETYDENVCVAKRWRYKIIDENNFTNELKSV